MKSLQFKNRSPIFFLAFILLAFSGFSTRSQASASQVDLDDPVVVRVYYGFRENLDMLAGMLDIWEVNHDQAYLVALVSPERYRQLSLAGYRLEIDTVKSAQINQPNQPLPGQGINTIPEYPCYRTVEETYIAMEALATNNPTLASWIDIGDSWDKLHAGDPLGYDLYALDLTNKITPGPKPVFFLMAEIHAREYVTAETAARFAEYLVANYGIDPDITWLLDYYHVYIVPMTNPDGRKLAEAGDLWRKNTDSDDGCTNPYSWGTDLNRNHNLKWDMGGSSDYACDETYHGPTVGSEPETQAIQNYVLALFPDQRGPMDTDPAPDDTTGVFITLHSYSQLVLWPWGWTATDSPNHTQLQTLGRKLAFFNSYTPQQSNDLYVTTGTSDDWAYGELGIAAYTFEMGSYFFQDCATFESTIYPNNRDSLLYAFKAARHPYMDPLGPESLSVTATPGIVKPAAPVVLEAVANDTRYRSMYPVEPTQNIAAARYTIDDPSWITDTVVYAMTSDDGGFNEKIEDVSALVDTTCLAPGRHSLFIESKDVNNNWGVPGAVFLTVIGSPPEVDPLVAYQSGDPGQAVIYNLSITNTNDLSDAFNILATSGWVVEAPFSIGPFAPYANDSLVVTVTIPITAPTNTLDVALVRIVSQNPAVLPITATLNTTAKAMYGMSVDAVFFQQSALPGETITYTLQITNTGRITDTYDISVTYSWDTHYSTPVGPLAVGESTGLAVVVTLPTSAVIGMSDTATVAITSQGDPERWVEITLVTTVKGNVAWIPIVVK